MLVAARSWAQAHAALMTPDSDPGEDDFVAERRWALAPYAPREGWSTRLDELSESILDTIKPSAGATGSTNLAQLRRTLNAAPDTATRVVNSLRQAHVGRNTNAPTSTENYPIWTLAEIRNDWWSANDYPVERVAHVRVRAVVDATLERDLPPEKADQRSLLMRFPWPPEKADEHGYDEGMRFLIDLLDGLQEYDPESGIDPDVCTEIDRALEQLNSAKVQVYDLRETTANRVLENFRDDVQMLRAEGLDIGTLIDRAAALVVTPSARRLLTPPVGVQPDEPSSVTWLSELPSLEQLSACRLAIHALIAAAQQVEEA